MTVRAKMRLVSKTDNASHRGGTAVESTTVRLQAVQGPDNEAWSKYTPNGTLELNITNPAAVGALELGREYFVDLTPAS